jgi:hypothetical protein
MPRVYCRVLESRARDISAMPCVPFRAGAAHVVALGTIGVAGALDQVIAARHDRIEAAEQRYEGRSRRQHGNLSVRLAEHEGERQNEDLVVEIIADMHDPVAPVFRIAPHD